MAERSNGGSSDWDGSSSWDDEQWQREFGPDAGAPPPADGPGKEPLRKRLFNNRTARFAASQVPLSMVPDDQSLGRLADAAEQFGWTVTDSDPEADELLASIPVRMHGYRAGNVVSGRFDPFTDRSSSGLPPGEWKFVAFDAVEDSRLGRTVRQCVSAVPAMVPVLPVRILPSRFPVGRSQGMVVYPTEDQVFDARFRILAPPLADAQGEDQLAALNALVDEDVRSALCSGVDSDELWTHGNGVLVTTAGPHDEDVLARHLTILGAALRALRRSTA